MKTKSGNFAPKQQPKTPTIGKGRFRNFKRRFKNIRDALGRWLPKFPFALSDDPKSRQIVIDFD